MIKGRYMKNRLNRTNKAEKAEKAKRVLISAASGCLLLLLYRIIFSFSAQDGETSSGLSMYIAEKGVELINAITGGHWTEGFMLGVAAYFENPIRKLAHFCEYAVMGVLVYTFLRPWLQRGKRLYLITVCWVFLSAFADELHQLFVPGRYSNPLDVILDTCGGAFGMMCVIAVEKWMQKRMVAYKREKEIRGK